jgi:hypothetical protein
VFVRLKGEHALQAQIIKLSRLLALDRSIPGSWRLLWLYHIPNGMLWDQEHRRVYAVAIGVLRGIPDLHLPAASGKYGGLYLEVKRPGERVPDEQLDIHEELRKMGNAVGVVRGVSDSERILRAYLCDPDGLNEWIPKL